jgi:hypothetical protein
MKNNEMLLQVNKNEFEVKQAENENKRKNFEAKRRRSLELRRKKAEEKSQEIQRILGHERTVREGKVGRMNILSHLEIPREDEIT